MQNDSIQGLLRVICFFNDNICYFHESNTMSSTIIIQQPVAAAQQLMLLYHGFGASPADMMPIGRRLAQEFPNAFVVSVQAANFSEIGAGYQWFGIRGITEENRPDRVAQAMPQFIASVEHWQKASGVDASATAIIGFSQGAIMALEATQQEKVLAARVIALSGRFAQLPMAISNDITVHFLHGKEDSVIHYGYCVTAAEHLVQKGSDITADILPFVDHSISQDMQDLIIERLKGHIPKRHWDEALKSSK